jgi:hypothetical protein
VPRVVGGQIREIPFEYKLFIKIDIGKTRHQTYNSSIIWSKKGSEICLIMFLFIFIILQFILVIINCFLKRFQCVWWCSKTNAMVVKGNFLHQPIISLVLMLLLFYKYRLTFIGENAIQEVQLTAEKLKSSWYTVKNYSHNIDELTKLQERNQMRVIQPK